MNGALALQLVGMDLLQGVSQLFLKNEEDSAVHPRSSSRIKSVELNFSSVVTSIIKIK